MRCGEWSWILFIEVIFILVWVFWCGYIDSCWSWFMFWEKLIWDNLGFGVVKVFFFGGFDFVKYIILMRRVLRFDVEIFCFFLRRFFFFLVRVCVLFLCLGVELVFFFWYELGLLKVMFNVIFFFFLSRIFFIFLFWCLFVMIDLGFFNMNLVLFKWLDRNIVLVSNVLVFLLEDEIVWLFWLVLFFWVLIEFFVREVSVNVIFLFFIWLIIGFGILISVFDMFLFCSFKSNSLL